MFRLLDKYPDKWYTNFPVLFRQLRNLKVQIRAGSRLYLSGPGQPSKRWNCPRQAASPTTTWKAAIEGTPTRILAGDGKLFVVTSAGRIYAFGEQAPATPAPWTPPSGEAGTRGGRAGRTGRGRVASIRRESVRTATACCWGPVRVGWPRNCCGNPTPRDRH